MVTLAKNVKYDGSRCGAVLEELRRFVSDSSPGRLLPSEAAICRKYGVSRIIAGKVLNRLATEGLIERHRGQGSFVKGQGMVTFLLPCPDFLSCDNNSAVIMRLRMQGAMRAAQERNLGFEAIAMSRINDIDCVEYSRLSRINAGSMVILDDWFRMVFPLLAERRARVALIEKQNIPYGYAQYTKSWHMMELRCRENAFAGLDLLHASGCRKIALLSCYVLSSRRHPVLLAYREWGEAHGMPEMVFELPGWNEDKLPPPRAAIMEFYRRHGFDGILLGYGYFNTSGTIQACLGVPDAIRVFGFDFSRSTVPLLEHFPCSCAPHERMGYDAVALLADHPGSGRSVSYYDYEMQP